MRRSTIGAYWPTDPRASADEVKAEVKKSLEALIRGKHLAMFAAKMRDIVEKEPDKTTQAIGRVRRELPVKMRAAERRWIEMYEGIEHQPQSAAARSAQGTWAHDRWPWPSLRSKPARADSLKGSPKRVPETDLSSCG